MGIEWFKGNHVLKAKSIFNWETIFQFFFYISHACHFFPFLTFLVVFYLKFVFSSLFYSFWLNRQIRIYYV